MAVFDTALPPTASNPATTSETTLFTSSADSSILVDVTNLSTSDQTVRVGIQPSGSTSTDWKVYDLSIPTADALLGAGPWFLQSSDKVQVAVGSTGSVVTFSLTGVETS